MSIRNNDYNACTASTFVLETALPSGWSGGTADSSIPLAPQNVAITTLSVTPATNTQGGSSTISVTAQDAENNRSGSGSTILALSDTTAPAAPTNLSATQRKKQVSLTWKGSTDNVKVTAYQISRNGTLIGSATKTSFTDGNTVIGQTYTYTVTARDAAGNISAQSNAVTLVKN